MNASATTQWNCVLLFLRDRVTRLRSVVRSNFGPDSAQYAQVGGTRSSERKSSKKKAKDQIADARTHMWSARGQ